MYKCRRVTGWHLLCPASLYIYSSRQVVEAYLKPAVDHDDQPCKWERPDLHGAHQSAGL